MMTKSEIVKIMTLIETSCENALNYKTDEQYDMLVEFWYDCFRNYPKDIMWQAVKQAIMHSEYTKQNWIGAVNKELQKIIAPPEKNDLQLWEEVNEKLYTVYETSRYLKYDQHYEGANRRLQNIYEKLSDDIKLYIVNASDLVRIAELKYGLEDRTGFNIERQSFLKRLPDLRIHRTERAQTEQVLKLVGAEDLKLLLLGNKR